MEVSNIKKKVFNNFSDTNKLSNENDKYSLCLLFKEKLLTINDFNPKDWSNLRKSCKAIKEVIDPELILINSEYGLKLKNFPKSKKANIFSNYEGLDWKEIENFLNSEGFKKITIEDSENEFNPQIQKFKRRICTAIINNDIKLMKKFLSLGVSMKTPVNLGKLLIHEIASNGNLSMCKLVVKDYQEKNNENVLPDFAFILKTDREPLVKSKIRAIIIAALFKKWEIFMYLKSKGHNIFETTDITTILEFALGKNPDDDVVNFIVFQCMKDKKQATLIMEKIINSFKDGFLHLMYSTEELKNCETLSNIIELIKFSGLKITAFEVSIHINSLLKNNSEQSRKQLLILIDYWKFLINLDEKKTLDIMDKKLFDSFDGKNIFAIDVWFECGARFDYLSKMQLIELLQWSVDKRLEKLSLGVCQAIKKLPTEQLEVCLALELDNALNNNNFGLVNALLDSGAVFNIDSQLVVEKMFTLIENNHSDVVLFIIKSLLQKSKDKNIQFHLSKFFFNHIKNDDSKEFVSLICDSINNILKMSHNISGLIAIDFKKRQLLAITFHFKLLNKLPPSQEVLNQNINKYFDFAMKYWVLLFVEAVKSNKFDDVKELLPGISLISSEQEGQ